MRNLGPLSVLDVPPRAIPVHPWRSFACFLPGLDEGVGSGEVDPDRASIRLGADRVKPLFDVEPWAILARKVHMDFEGRGGSNCGVAKLERDILVQISVTVENVALYLSDLPTQYAPLPSQTKKQCIAPRYSCLAHSATVVRPGDPSRYTSHRLPPAAASSRRTSWQWLGPRICRSRQRSRLPFCSGKDWPA